MSSRTGSLTQTQSIRSGALGLPLRGSDEKKQPCASPPYQVEEHEPVNTPVPLNSPLGIATHLATWMCWVLYFFVRLPNDRQSTSSWFWLIYFCEAAFVLQDFQTALELTFSLFGPRKFFRHTQYSLKGDQAPTVSVLIT